MRSKRFKWCPEKGCGKSVVYDYSARKYICGICGSVIDRELVESEGVKIKREKRIKLRVLEGIMDKNRVSKVCSNCSFNIDFSECPSCVRNPGYRDNFVVMKKLKDVKIVFEGTIRRACLVCDDVKDCVCFSVNGKQDRMCKVCMEKIYG